MGAKKSSQRSQRVTQVDPWIFGGEGRLVDLFPFNPWIILLGRFILACLKHPLRTIITLMTIYLYTSTDSLLSLGIPLGFYILVATYFIGKNWYHSPEVPLIRKRQN